MLTKKLKIIDKYKDSVNTDTSLVRNSSLNAIKTDNPWLQYIVNEIESLEPAPTNTPSNVTTEERKAVKDLKENKNIVIKKADKTNVFVVMDTCFYRDKLVMEDHLNQPTYEKTNEDADKKVFSNSAE